MYLSWEQCPSISTMTTTLFLLFFSFCMRGHMYACQICLACSSVARVQSVCRDDHLYSSMTINENEMWRKLIKKKKKKKEKEKKQILKKKKKELINFRKKYFRKSRDVRASWNLADTELKARMLSNNSDRVPTSSCSPRSAVFARKFIPTG